MTGVLPAERLLTIDTPRTAADVHAVVALARRMHAEGAYAFLPFDATKVAASVVASAALADRYAAIAVRGGVIVGFLGGALTTYPFCNERLAHDVGFYVAPEARASSAAVRLIQAFRAWAVEQGAREVSLGVSSGVEVDRIERLYTRLGFRRMGGVYRERLGAAADSQGG
ncbi:MAG TPA: GNAT family N-acetyltransferase [Byssovorax sp.]|jgi:GNAT superfamily N-acetyltransferase